MLDRTRFFVCQRNFYTELFNPTTPIIIFGVYAINRGTDVVSTQHITLQPIALGK